MDTLLLSRTQVRSAKDLPGFRTAPVVRPRVTNTQKLKIAKMSLGQVHREKLKNADWHYNLLEFCFFHFIMHIYSIKKYVVGHL